MGLITFIRSHLERRPTAAQILRFGIVGVANTGVHFVLYVILTTFAHVHYLVANPIAFTIATMNSFYFNRRWTFRNADPAWRRQLVKFFIITTIGFGMNEGILYLLVSQGRMTKLPAEAVAIAVVLIWNYLANKWWTFRTK